MFKKSYFIILLAFSSSVLGIEKPYEPHFSAKHPIISRTLSSLAAGLGAAAATYKVSNFFQDKHAFARSLVAGAVVGTGAWIYDAFKKPNLLDTILCDPKKALLYSSKVQNNMESEFARKGLDTITNAQQASNYKALVRKYESESPLLLLSECTQEGKNPCVLSRIHNPKIRETYEERMAQALLQKSAVRNLTTYASFGGGKFQDLVIATKFLAKNPIAKLAIHLIDDTHTPYIAYLDLGKKSREITAQELDLTDVMNAMPQLIAKAKTEWGSKKIDAEISAYILKFIIPVDLEYKEFLNWLRTNFPKATITLSIHESAQSYIQAISEGKCEYPDVLSAAEIQHDISKFQNSLPNYLDLCIKVLSKKPNSINMLLTKRLKDQNEPCIITCSLQSSQNARSCTLTDSNKNSCTIYFTEHKI